MLPLLRLLSDHRCLQLTSLRLRPVQSPRMDLRLRPVQSPLQSPQRLRACLKCPRRVLSLVRPRVIRSRRV
jgi:hypothetical protein